MFQLIYYYYYHYFQSGSITMPISLIKIRRSESVTASQTSYAKLFTLMFDDLRNYMYNENNL